MWNLKQLEYFVAVADAGSISSASGPAHVTQPGMSKAIKAMEDGLGLVLFERGGKRLHLTDAGLVVYKHAKLIMAGLEDLDAELAEVAGAVSGSLRLGVPPMVGANFFPRILAGFRHRFPGISITLAEYGAARVEQEVSSGGLDCGMALLPLGDPGLGFLPFGRERMMAVVSASHPLTGRGSVGLGELAGDPVILYTEDFSLHGRIKEACMAAGFQPKVAWESSQWDFIGQLAAEGLGVAFLPEPICRELDPASVSVLSLTDPEIPWHLALVWRRNRYLSFACREFIRFTREHLVGNDETHPKVGLDGFE